MKVEVKVGKQWRETEAVIDVHGGAIITLPTPYGQTRFAKGKWRKIKKAKRNGR